jgi:hypothetical protein
LGVAAFGARAAEGSSGDGFNAIIGGGADAVGTMAVEGGAGVDVEVEFEGLAVLTLVEEAETPAEFPFEFGLEVSIGAEVEAEGVGSLAGAESATFESRFSSLLVGECEVAFIFVADEVGVTFDGVAAGEDAACGCGCVLVSASVSVDVVVTVLDATAWGSLSAPRLFCRPFRPAMDEVIAARATSSFVTSPSPQGVIQKVSPLAGDGENKT